MSAKGSLFRDEYVSHDCDQGFEELETVRLYLKEDTLWDLEEPGLYGYHDDTTDADDIELFEPECPAPECVILVVHLPLPSSDVLC